MMLQDRLDYTIQLPVFEGPLDLLLRLIEREELDITNIALAQVADQYLAHVRAMEAPDPAALSSFLVIAARLLLIKSRALLPRPPVNRAAEEVVDEGEELVRQLREYQRYKQAAQLLRTWQDEGRRVYTRQAPPPLPTFERSTKLDSTLSEMIAAVQRRMQLVMSLEEQTVPLPTPKIITVPEMASTIQGRLQTQAWFDFTDLLSVTVQRVEVIVALWTVLELLKRQIITVEQTELFGSISIGRGPAFDETRLYRLDVKPSDDETIG